MSYDEFLTTAIEACKQSGAIQMDRRKQVRQIDFKGAINLVTDVDKACEQTIIQVIQGQYPNHDILAEEGGGKRTDSDYKWVIDPLDGTTNYAHGYPLFATSIALEHHGEIVLAAVYEPNLKELFTAIKGQGAYLNGEKIKASKTLQLEHALLSTGFAYNIREVQRNNIPEFNRFLLKARAIRRDGVASTDLCYIACGRFDGFWELELYPWDVAAGMLILQEAGGKVSNYSGKDFSIYDKEIVASNGLIHEAMLDVIRMV